MRKKPEYGLGRSGDEARTFGSRANRGFEGRAPMMLFLVMPHCVAAIPRCMQQGILITSKFFDIYHGQSSRFVRLKPI
jgi:hypothetical protein